MYDEEDLIQIQKSTRTTVARFVPLHNYLRMRYKWYYAWHLKNYANTLHIAGVGVFAVLAFFFSTIILNPASESKIEATSQAGDISQIASYPSSSKEDIPVPLEEDQLSGSPELKAKINETETYLESIGDRRNRANSNDKFWIKSELTEAKDITEPEVKGESTQDESPDSAGEGSEVEDIVSDESNPEEENVAVQAKNKVETPKDTKAEKPKSNTLEWKDTFSNVDITQELYHKKIKETITVKDQDAPTTFVYQLSSSDGTTYREDNGDILFVKDDREVARILKPVTKDAEDRDIAFRYDLDGSTLTLTPDQDLKDVSYPLYIDPTYVVEERLAWTNYPYQRKLVRGSDGTLYSAYGGVDDDDYHWTGYVAKSIDNGQTWTSEVVCQGTDDLDVNNVSLAIDSHDNLHVVMEVWDYSPNMYKARYRKYDHANGIWGAIEDVGIAGGNNFMPTLAVDGSDNLHLGFVAWGTGYNGVYHKIFSDSWQPETQIAEATATSDHCAYGPSMAIDSAGHVHFGWESSPTSACASARVRYRELTDSLQPIVTVAADTNWQGNYYSPQIAVDNNDLPHLVWDGTTATSPDNYQIRYRKYTDSWQPIEEITNNPEKIYFLPSIGIDSIGNIHLVWSGDCVYDSGYICQNIGYRKYSSSWQEVTSILSANYRSPSLINSQFPQVDGVKTNIPNTGFALVVSDRTDVNISYFASSDLTWGQPAPAVFSISGSVTYNGVGLPGVTVSDGTRSATTDTNGVYTITSVPDGTYTLAPSLSGYTFSPATLEAVVSGANLSGKNFTASLSTSSA